jgi:hypothetical protein
MRAQESESHPRCRHLFRTTRPCGARRKQRVGVRIRFGTHALIASTGALPAARFWVARNRGPRSAPRSPRNRAATNLLAAKRQDDRRAERLASSYAGSSLLEHFDSFIDDLSGETVDRHVHPVRLFAFYNAFEICSGGINTELIDILTTDRT